MSGASKQANGRASGPVFQSRFLVDLAHSDSVVAVWPLQKMDEVASLSALPALIIQSPFGSRKNVISSDRASSSLHP